ncbi:hypothetical protein BKA67DRAFT_587155 [Truncatella angustata]|uniref:F-box domain-containing protein n=1 Tax=Truncatella angustata TaxID=152316 RepID=A0A9P8UAU3_9PEZI|nr:uncharacterized protein BKA67DRAFT_587155 [Truncatella angustata]KAH6645197.1 hypothetical protein BKA67DRAFT_587155 [Truncatella angustata]
MPHFLKGSRIASSKIRKDEQLGDEELEPLEDKTEPLQRRSKRTERAERKQKQKVEKHKVESQVTHILELPHELVLEILYYCQPSTLMNLRRTSRAYRDVLLQEESRILDRVCDLRYRCLRKCFHPPVLLKHGGTQKRAQKTIPAHSAPDPALICTCFICLLRWNSLNIILDFAHYQNDLERGNPLPIMPRGIFPENNRKLLDDHATIVRKALESPLWHARILEEHLRSTTRAISRHAANKGNKRRRFRMTKEDMESESDRFLERSGPPTADIPYMRDNYYMLETFMPNRGWNLEENRWMYLPKEQHDTDLNIVVSWARWRAQQAAIQVEAQ